MTASESPDPPIAFTLEEALERGLRGWNLRWSACGSYGAHWLRDAYPVALCPMHEAAYWEECHRHRQALAEMCKVRFPQLPAEEIRRRRDEWLAVKRPKRRKR